MYPLSMRYVYFINSCELVTSSARLRTSSYDADGAGGGAGGGEDYH